MEKIQFQYSESQWRKNEKYNPRFNNDKMVLARNVGIKLLVQILDSGDGRSKTETVTQQMVAKHQQEMTTKIINHADKRHSLRSSLQLEGKQGGKMYMTSYTPPLAPVFFESPPPWKIPSQGVQGRSRDFRNVKN